MDRISDIIPVRDKKRNFGRTGGMPLKRSQAVPFVAEEACRQSYKISSEFV